MGSWVPQSLICFVPKGKSLPSLLLPASPHQGAHNVSLFPQCHVWFAPTQLSLGTVATASHPFRACIEQLQKCSHKKNFLLKGVSSKLNCVCLPHHVPFLFLFPSWSLKNPGNHGISPLQAQFDVELPHLHAQLTALSLCPCCS